MINRSIARQPAVEKHSVTTQRSIATQRPALPAGSGHSEADSLQALPSTEADALQFPEDEQAGAVLTDFPSGSVLDSVRDSVKDAAQNTAKDSVQLSPSASFPKTDPDYTESIRELEMLRTIQAEHRKQLQENRRAAIEKKRRTRQLVLLGKAIDESFPGAVGMNEDEMHRFAAGLAAKHNECERSGLSEGSGFALTNPAGNAIL